MVESVDAVTKRIKSKRHNYVVKDVRRIKENNYINNIISKILLSIIFFLSSAIFINYSTTNKKIYEKYIFTDSMSFKNFQNLYNKYFGNILPKLNNNDVAVFNNMDI